jgi:hypothetical protein
VVVVRNGNTPTAGSTTGWVVHLNFGKSEFRQPSNFVISGSSSLKRIVHAEMDKCHADDPVEVMPQALVWLEQRAVAAARAEAKTMVQTEIKNMLRRMIGP